MCQTEKFSCEQRKAKEKEMKEEEGKESSAEKLHLKNKEKSIVCMWRGNVHAIERFLYSLRSHLK